MAARLAAAPPTRPLSTVADITTVLFSGTKTRASMLDVLNNIPPQRAAESCMALFARMIRVADEQARAGVYTTAHPHELVCQVFVHKLRADVRQHLRSKASDATRTDLVSPAVGL